MRAGLGVVLVGLVVCVGCGPSKEEEEEAIAAIKALGGKFEVARPREFDELPEMLGTMVLEYPSGPDVTDAQLVHLKRLPKIEILILINTNITDAGLVHLKGLTNLQVLVLNGNRITDAGLVHLKGLTKLKWLFLPNTWITDAGLVHLKGLSSLKKLILNDSFAKVTDAGVKQLQQALPNCKIKR